ncbi:MAG: hypothetical protein GX256_00805 [Fretibacterium sp.]|nr:hypothetical protein [Fretibacterium sp.]
MGQVVISKRGKDAGNTYVIVGFLDGSRLALADAVRFNVTNPKAKNPKHVQPTSRCITEILDFVEAGKDIDHGRFRHFLSLLDENALVDEQNRDREAG